MSKKTKIIIGIAIGLLVMTCAAYGITVYMSHTVRTKPTVPMAEPSTVTDAEEVTEETVADKDATEQKKTDKPDAKDKVDKDEKTTEAAKDKETKKEDTTEAKKDTGEKEESTTEAKKTDNNKKKETTTESPKGNDGGNKQTTTEAPKKETTTEAPKKETSTEAPKQEASSNHTWVWKTHTETVHHTEKYLIGEAYDEPVYVNDVICNCGAVFPNDAALVAVGHAECGGCGTHQSISGYIHHDAEYGVDEWDTYEEVNDYQYCSKCGVRK